MNKIEYKLKGKCGIYIFTNLENGKRYIGSSVDIYNRIHEHIHNLNNNKAHNKHFQNAWNKYGEDCFIYSVLEYCSTDQQFEREQYYIDFIKPEYNLTLNVIANYGHNVSDETKKKISNTLKEKYSTGEIQTYRQEHNWRKTWIYNIRTYKLEAVCDCAADAIRLLGNKRTAYDNVLYSNRYCISFKKFNTLSELQNHINQTFLASNSKFGKYIVCEDEKGNLTYYRTLVDCARDNFSSKSTLSKHSNATKNNPYIIRQSKRKFYYTNDYIPVKQNAVPIEESSELLSGNIGETPEMGNTEINSEIKESESSYSVEDETKNGL